MDTDESDAQPLGPPPLVRKRKAGGKAYTRPAEVERQITEVLVLDAEQIHQRAQLAPEDPGSLLDETLVFLIQQRHKSNENVFRDLLAQILVERCTPIFKKAFGRLGEDAAQNLSHKVLVAVFENMLDSNAGQADMMQVRFRMVLKRRAIDEFRRFKSTLEQRDIQIAPDALENGWEQLSLGQSAARDKAHSLEDQFLVDEALQAIRDPQHREAYVLRHKFGMQLDSKDPNVPTLAAYFGKSEKTLRLWLERAQEEIDAYKEEIYDE